MQPEPGDRGRPCCKLPCAWRDKPLFKCSTQEPARSVNQKSKIKNRKSLRQPLINSFPDPNHPVRSAPGVPGQKSDACGGLNQPGPTLLSQHIDQQNCRERPKEQPGMTKQQINNKSDFPQRAR